MSNIDAKRLFDKVREIKGSPLTQADVDAINAIIEPLQAKPIPTHPKLSDAVIRAAIRSEGQWNIPASVRLAQFAVESAWGTKMPGGLSSNNPFGVKARVRNGVPIDPYVTSNTREVITGKEVYIKAPFRKFASLDEAFDEQAKLLATAGAYAKARAKLPDVDAFADALTGVYATDPHYGETLKSIMRSQKLYAFNGLSGQLQA